MVSRMLPRTRQLGGVLAALVMSVVHAPAAVAPSTETEIARAIEQLGAPDFRTRERATRLLWEAGRAAEAALQKAVESADPEVALRARELLTNLKYGIRPDTPPQIRELAVRYHASEPDGRMSVVTRLLEQGDAAFEALSALAAAETDLEARVYIFTPVLERASQSIQELIHKDTLVEKQVADAIRLVRLAMVVLPEDLIIALEVVPRLDELAKRKDADELFAQAFSYHKKLCDESPRDADRHNNLAWLCAIARRRLDEALAHAQKAVGLERANPMYLDTLAEVHFQRGNQKEAIELMKKCIQLDPDTEYYRLQLRRFEQGATHTRPPVTMTRW
jgi:tetratricopeptide (TPR) repeat protein